MNKIKLTIILMSQYCMECFSQQSENSEIKQITIRNGMVSVLAISLRLSSPVGASENK